MIVPEHMCIIGVVVTGRVHRMLTKGKPDRRVSVLFHVGGERSSEASNM